MQITITARSVTAAQLIRVAMAAMTLTPAQQVFGVHLSVTDRDGGWCLTDHGNDVKRRAGTEGDLVYQITDRLVHHVADGASGHHALHAAAVARGKRALLMPAGSGSGKSLLTAWLVAHGFDYISDEMVLLDQQYAISGLARPIQVKPSGLEAVSRMVEARDSIILGRRSNSVPVQQLRGRVSPLKNHQLALVVFPEFQPGAAFELSPMTPAAAGLKFMSHHINARNLQGHGFPSLMKLVRGSPCYALRYGDFDDLPEDFTGQLDGLLEPSVPE